MMERIYFRTDTSEPVGVLSTPDGEVDFRALGEHFGLEWGTIRLCDTLIPKSLSVASWTQIKKVLDLAGTREKPVLVGGRPSREASTVDNTPSIRRAIVEQSVRFCNLYELPGFLKSGLEEGLRFPVPLGMWNSLPSNRNQLFKLAGSGEECYTIIPLVNIIVAPPMPAPTADTEDSFHHFWDTVIEEPLKFFYDGSWLAERNKSGEGATSGTSPDKVVRFGFNRYALWRGEEKGPSTPGDPK